MSCYLILKIVFKKETNQCSVTGGVGTVGVGTVGVGTVGVGTVGVGTVGVS